MRPATTYPEPRLDVWKVRSYAIKGLPCLFDIRGGRKALKNYDWRRAVNRLALRELNRH